jgi:hypothetical protein
LPYSRCSSEKEFPSPNRKQENSLNLWHCEVSEPRKTRRLHGYLLKDSKHLFDDMPSNNPHLSHLSLVQAGQAAGNARAEISP